MENMEMNRENPLSKIDFSFFRNKKIFITGHTGFKGAWLCGILLRLGACVTGYALSPPDGGAFELCSLDKDMDSRIGDIRDFNSLKTVFREASPEIVIHMAAQPIVLDSYERPAYTFDVNAQGTVNLLECVRSCDTVRSLLIITTDKVYKNNEWCYGYRETDELGGSDPYSASKACAELIVNSYDVSFFRKISLPISTARAGNVIGGGDVSPDRIICDCVRQVQRGEEIYVRNPRSVRPYQHVLDVLSAYLLIAMRQYSDISVAGRYNIGPYEHCCVTTEELVKVFCETWGSPARFSLNKTMSTNARHEAGLLRLDCSKIRSVLGHEPIWDIKTAIQMTVKWEKSKASALEARTEMNNQIDIYLRRERQEYV